MSPSGISGVPSERPPTRKASTTWRRWYPASAYSLLVIYASLYPLVGWRDSGAHPLEFLAADWPRYFTGFDLVTNLLAYAPMGVLWFVVFRRRWPNFAWLAAVLLGIGASFCLEVVQNYLPSRVPSNVDLACNALGTILGVGIGMRWSGLLDTSRWGRWRDDLLVAGEGAEVGLLLLAGWLVTQLSPENILFGTGNLRRMLDLPLAQAFSAERFIHVEAAVAATGLLAVGLMVSMLLKQNSHLRLTALCLGLLLLALLIKTLGYALLMTPTAAFGWVTPGNAQGLGVGLTLWFVASFLHFRVQRALAAASLLLATVMVNIAPENPYLANTLDIWNPGHFLNFNGLTRLVCSLWPFLALAWLMVYRATNNERN